MNKFLKCASMFLALAMIFTVAGCKSQDSVDSEDEIIKTPEQQIEENKNITDDQINLVQFEEVPDGAQVARIETSMGEIVAVLYPEEAPKAVENFVALAKSGYYTGLSVHRVISNYLIQSGDPTGTGTGGESSFKDESGNLVGFEGEYSLNMWNFKGALGMVPNADGLNGSQFYMIVNSALEQETLDKMEEANFPQKVIDKYKEVGGAPWMDGKYTVFAQVVEGLEILDEIAAVAVDENKVPEEDIIITQITIDTY